MENANFIVKTLNKKGYIAYFAGGWVRDFLLDHPSDDIDIATNAPPEIVEKIFKKTIPLGKAFGIILVIIKNQKYEVATFRKDISYKDGRRPNKVEYTSAEIDASRRDFTINGMFFDPIKKEIIDFVNGKEDLKKKIIKCIGNPVLRFKEDKLRMIRAVRLSARFDFEIEKNTKKAILDHSKELFPSVAIERIVLELHKMSLYKGFKKAILNLFELNLLQTIFPEIKSLKLKELEKRLFLIDSFPKKTPIIISILEIFPDYNLYQKIDLCKYLKLSNDDIEFVKFYTSSKKILKNEHKISNYDWVIFFSNKLNYLCTEIFAVHIDSKKRVDFLHFLEKKENELQFFIEKVKNNDPILKAQHVKRFGIKPGPLMGKILQMGNKLAINKKIIDPFKLIEILKTKSIWEGN